MRILSLKINDILSIQDAVLTFEDSGLVLVDGWNYDTQRANGAGKTALFNSLAFALYDRLPRKITASEILRRGCKSGYAEASVLCGTDTWTVRRSRPKGVIFSKNGVTQDITQSEFESFIRLSYEQFLLTIYTPQANSRELIRFLSCADSSKKEFLLQLLNLDGFAGIKSAADLNVKAKQAAIDLEEKKIAVARSKIEAYEESEIDTALLQTKIKTLTQSIKTLETELIGLSDVPRPDLSKYTKVENGLRAKQLDISQAKARRGLLHDRFREIKGSIVEYDASTSCGECGSSLDTLDARVAHAGHVEKAKLKAKSIKEQIDETDTIISEENAINAKASQIYEKKQSESADYQIAQVRIATIKSLSDSHKRQLSDTNLKLQNAAELSSKIKALADSIIVALLQIKDNRRLLEVYKTISAIHSPTGAQAYVLDSVVDSFNEIIQKYVDIMSPNITYILNSFKENAKGDVVAKFSETLMKSGADVSVGSLSGGEEKGLSLCVDFALLEVLETQFGMTLNPIILDEPFDGLDSAGRELVIDLLETLSRNRQIFVVDHSSEAKSMFSSVVRLELRNDISTLSVVS